MKTLFLNRFGLTGLAANTFLLLWGVFDRGFGDRSFHFYYDPLPIKILTVVNLPALAAADSLNAAVFPATALASSMLTISNFHFAAFLFFCVCQWVLIGGLLQFITARKLK